MALETVRSRADSDIDVYASPIVDSPDRQPLVDLRTRLVLLILFLFFFSLVYVGLNGTPV